MGRDNNNGSSASTGSRNKRQRLRRRCLQSAFVAGASILLARSAVQLSSVHVATRASQTEALQMLIPTDETKDDARPPSSRGPTNETIAKNARPPSPQGLTNETNEDARPISSQGPTDETITMKDARPPSSQVLTKKTTKVARPLSSQRILLFVTTHMPPGHQWNLRSCWPPTLKNSRLLRAAHVAVYLNAPPERREEGTKTLRETFKNQNLTIYVRDNLGYQEGAMSALSDAAKEGWFQGYDWVVRANPDVIVRDDSFMVNVMENDVSATGLLVNCTYPRNLRVHTDFFAIKPSALGRDAFLNPGDNAEGTFTRDVREGIVGRGGARWIDDSSPRPRGTCRAGTGRKMNEADVIHFHAGKEVMRNTSCPIPFPNN